MFPVRMTFRNRREQSAMTARQSPPSRLILDPVVVCPKCRKRHLLPDLPTGSKGEDGGQTWINPLELRGKTAEEVTSAFRQAGEPKGSWYVSWECPHCGFVIHAMHEAPPPVKCRYCGIEVPKDVKKCPSCGAPV